MESIFKSQITLTRSWINKVKQGKKYSLMQEYKVYKYLNILGIIKEVMQHLKTL